MNWIWRSFYRLYRMSSGAWHWLRRKLTMAGWFVAVSLFVTMLTGLDTENMVVYQAFPLLLFLLLTAFAFSRFFRLKFTASRTLPKFGTVGTPFTYHVTVRNGTGKAQDGLTLFDDLADPRPTFAEWLAVQLVLERTTKPLQLSGRGRVNPFRIATVKEAALPAMRPNQEVETTVRLTPLRRGVLRFAGVTVARTDPLGLMRALARSNAPQTMLILPKRYALPPLALPGAMKYQQGGVALASSVGQSEEFVGLRDYRRGDPMRHIHWRSWAKAGKPIVKEFEDEFFVRHALVLDTFTADPHSEVFEEAVSVASSFACTIQTQESLLDLLFVEAEAYCFTVGRGLAHGDQMLEILASVRVCAGKPFETLETKVLDHVGVVSGCICVLLAWDETRRKFVEKLQALGVPLLVVVVLAAAPMKPLDPGPMRDEAERFHTLVVGKMEEGLAAI